MPIKTIEGQFRLHEDGRIRIGDTEENRGATGTHPVRLDKFRLTSASQTLLLEAAALWGGTVTVWDGHEGQYELFTEATELPVIISPTEMTQWYEEWSGGGCKRRCDGETDQITGGPCTCDPENRKCKPTTRLALWLPDLHGMGVWRLETHGYYAAVELPPAVQFLQAQARGGNMIEASLGIDARTQKEPGKPSKNFTVPVLRSRVRLRDMLTGASRLRPSIEGQRQLAIAAQAIANGDLVDQPVYIAGEPVAPSPDTDPFALDAATTVEPTTSDATPAAPVPSAPTTQTPPLVPTASSAPRTNGTPPNPPDTWQGPGLCPKCHAPEGKPHTKKCEH